MIELGAKIIQYQTHSSILPEFYSKQKVQYTTAVNFEEFDLYNIKDPYF